MAWTWKRREQPKFTLRERSKQEYDYILGADSSKPESFIDHPRVFYGGGVQEHLDKPLSAGQFIERLILRNAILSQGLGGRPFNRCVFDHINFGVEANPDLLTYTAKFRLCEFINCRFSSCHFANCQFISCRFVDCHLDTDCLIDHVIFQKCSGLRELAGLTKVDIREPQQSSLQIRPPIETTNLQWDEKWVSWEALGIAGRLPLFGLSTAALLTIPVVTWGLDLYNMQADRFRSWATGHADAFQAVPELAHVAARIQPIPMPSLTLWTLVSTLLLGIASVLYAFCCPQRVKEFTSVRWLDDHRQHPIRYFPLSWSKPRIRRIVGFCYVVGGFLSGVILLWKLGGAALRIIEVTVKPWWQM